MLQKTSALIIDDAEDICFLVSQILKRIGIEADCANNLKEADVALSKKDYPIIILDNHLPDGQGIDFIGKIKKSYPDSKIIMVTAYEDEATRTISSERGASFFVAKPFDVNTLNRVIKELLGDTL